MLFNSEEQKMYRMIQAVYDSGIPTTHSYLSSLMPLEKDKGLMIG